MWVLIITLSLSSYGVSVTSIDFDSKETCNSALKAYEEKIINSKRGQFASIESLCVKK